MGCGSPQSASTNVKNPESQEQKPASEQHANKAESSKIQDELKNEQINHKQDSTKENNKNESLKNATKPETAPQSLQNDVLKISKTTEITPETIDFAKFNEEQQLILDKQDKEDAQKERTQILAELSKDIVYQGKNYGKPILIGSAFYLTVSIDAQAGVEYIPCAINISGWRLPSKQELTELAELANENPAIFNDKKIGFKAEPKVVYISGAKVYPDKVDGKDIQSWQFFGMIKDENKGKYVVEPHNSFSTNVSMKARLVSDKLHNFPEIAEENRFAFFYSPMSDGIESVLWDFGDSTNSNEQNSVHKYSKAGIYTVTYKAKLSNGKESVIQNNVRVIPRILRYPPIIIDGINYGCPIIIGNQTWLDRDLLSYKTNDGKIISLIRGKGPENEGANGWEYSMNACPRGWKLPTKKEIEDLIQYAGSTPEERFTFFKYKNGFNPQFSSQGDAVYCGSEQNGNEAWSLTLNKGDAKLSGVFRWACKGINFSTRCIASSTLDLCIKPNSDSISCGETIKFTSELTQYLKLYEWTFSDTNEKIQARSVKHIFLKPGEYQVSLKVTLQNGSVLNQIKQISVTSSGLYGLPIKIHDEVYTQKIAIGSQVWMSCDVRKCKVKNEIRNLERYKGPGEKGQPDYRFIEECAPVGWRLPTKKEVEELIKYAGNTQEQRFNFFTNPNGFNAIPTGSGWHDAIFITSTPADGNSQYGLYISKNEITIKPYWKFANGNEFYSTRFVANDYEKLSMSPSFACLICGTEYDFELLDKPGIAKIVWDFGDGTILEGFNVKHKYSKISEYTMKVSATTLSGIEIIANRVIWVPNCALFGEPVKMYDEEYGQKIAVGSQVWMSCDARKCKIKNEVHNLERYKGPGEKGQPDYRYIEECAPLGWRLPTKAEVEELIKLAGNTQEQRYSFFTHPNGFNAIPAGSGWCDAIFITSTPTDSNGQNGLFISKNEIGVKGYWKFANGHEFYSTRFVADDYRKLSISPSSASLICQKEYDFELIDKTGVAKLVWDFGDGTIAEGFKVKHKYPKPAEYRMKITALTISGIEIVANRLIWIPSGILFGEPVKMYDEEYGQKMLIGKQVWMSRDFKKCKVKTELRNLERFKGPGEKGQSDHRFIAECAPRCWRLPTKQEAEELIKLAGNNQVQRYEFFTNPDALNAIPKGTGWNDSIFITSSLAGDNGVYGLYIYKNEIQMKDYWKFSNAECYYSTRFVADDEVKLAISPYSSSLICCKEYEFDLLDKQAVAKVIWDFGDGKVLEGFKVKHAYTKPQEYNMKIKAVLECGVEINVDRKIWINYCSTQQDDEIFKDLNYGKPVLLGNQVWMTPDVEYTYSGGQKKSLIRDNGAGDNKANALQVSRDGAPPGWRFPTKADLEELLAWSGKTILQKIDCLTSKETFGAEYLQIKEDIIIGSTTIFENSMFCIQVTKEEALVKEFWRFGGSSFSTRYIACDKTHTDFKWPTEDIFVNTPIQIKCRHSRGYKSITWSATEHENETHDSNREFIFKTPGKKIVKVKGIRHDGSEFNTEHVLWCRQCFTSEKDAKLDISNIKMIKLADYCELRNAVHFTSAYAPIAPRLLGGGAYFVIKDKVGKSFVNKFDAKYYITMKICELGEINVLDIHSTLWGFCVLVSNPKLFSTYFKGYNDDGKLRFSVTLMNNGVDAKEPKDQIMFYLKEKELQFGTQCMLDSSSGRIESGRGRFTVCVAHNNLFGYYEDGSRNVHTGCSFFSFDEDGNDPKIGFGWAVSHSLREHLIYNGTNFIVTSLGDAFPHGINSVICPPHDYTDHKDPVHNIHNQLNVRHIEMVKNLVGSGFGCSSGRFGSMVQIGDYYYLPYSSKKGEYLFQKKKKMKTETDEFALLKLDWQLNILDKYVYGPGNNILVINTVRYGKNILIFTVETKNVLEDFNVWFDYHDPAYVRLVDENGKILMDKTELPMGFAIADDPRTLENGIVVWTTEGKNQELYLCVLDP